MNAKNTGNTKQCLEHFYEHYGTNCADTIAKALDVSVVITRRWKSRGTLPGGKNLLSLRLLLKALGYNLTDFQVPNENIVLLGKCVAYGLIGLDEVAQRLSMASADYLYCYFFGKHKSMSAERMKTVVELVAQFRVSINAADIAQKEFISQNFGRVADAPPTINAGEYQKLIGDFVTACARIRELTEQLLKASPTVRHEMRNKMTQSGNPTLHLTWEGLHKLLKESKI